MHTPQDREIFVLSADDFTSIPFPGYKEIRLSLSFPSTVRQAMDEIHPDYIHIATEGPIGIVGAYICKKYSLPYTTSFHTKFPEYLNMRNRLIKEDYVHKYLHYIHNDAEKIFISNQGMISYLKKHWYGRYCVVPLGIDHESFFPGKKTRFTEDSRTVLLFVGRIAIEKNIEAFLSISNQYRKIVVWDGPKREEFEKKYPDTEFLGIQKGRALAEIYQSADIFIFPSHTDTLGLVNLEAMACGIPVIAYDIENMQGIIQHGVNGILVPLDKSLESGIPSALALPPNRITQSVARYRWREYSKKFFLEQAPIAQNHYPLQ